MAHQLCMSQEYALLLGEKVKEHFEATHNTAYFSSANHEIPMINLRKKLLRLALNSEDDGMPNNYTTVVKFLDDTLENALEEKGFLTRERGNSSLTDRILSEHKKNSKQSQNYQHPQYTLCSNA